MNETTTTTKNGRRKPQNASLRFFLSLSHVYLCVCMFKITGLFFVVFRVFGAHSNENVHSSQTLFVCHQANIMCETCRMGQLFVWVYGFYMDFVSQKCIHRAQCTHSFKITQTEYHGRLRRKHLATTSTRR